MPKNRQGNKIAVIIPSLQIGGAEKSLVKLLNLLNPNKFTVKLFIVANASEQMLSELNEDISVVQFGARSSASPVLLFKLLIGLLIFRPKILFGWSTYANLLACILSIFLKSTKLVISERNYIPRIYSKISMGSVRRFVTLRLILVLYPLADVVTCNSEVGLKFLRRLFKCRVKFLHLKNHIEAVDLTRKSNSYFPYSDSGIAEKKILALGRLDWQKGFDLLVRAISVLSSNTNENFRVYIVGSGIEASSLGKLAEELNVSHLITWVGEMENPYPYIRHADLVVVPSRFEGFPNVVLETMFIGTPLVCTNFMTGAAEATSRGSLASLVPLEDSLSLATEISRVLLNIGEARNRAERGRLYVSVNYSAESVLSVLDPALMELVNKK